MKTAIILHGKPDKEEYFLKETPSQSNRHWIPWIQKQFILNEVLAQTPEMPEPYEPKYEEWKKIFEKFDINENTTLIGHSCGGGFLVRYISENKIKVGKVILVAPWIDPDNDMKSNFFEFEIDQNLVSKTSGLVIMYSTDDDSSIIDTVNILKSKLKDSRFQKFTDKGHFCYDDLKTDKFPELLENIK